MIVDAEKMDRDSRDVIDLLAPKIPADDLTDLRTYSEVGEWIELAEHLCATLVTQHIPVTAEDLTAIANLLDQFSPDDDTYYPYLSRRASTVAAITVAR